MALNYPWSPQVSMAGPSYTMNPYGQSPMNSIYWVTGEAGAKAHPIAPNSSVLLMDQESNKFYVKSADLLGIPTIRTYEYNELTAIPTVTAQVAPTEEKVDYVSRKEFDELKKTIDDLMS